VYESEAASDKSHDVYFLSSIEDCDLYCVENYEKSSEDECDYDVEYYLVTNVCDFF